MNKDEIKIGMKIYIPIYNYKHKLIEIREGIALYKGNNFVTVRTREGYSESFFYRDVRRTKEV